MRWSIVLALFRRDLLEALRDRRTLVMLVGVPVVLYPLLLAAGGALSGAMVKKLDDQPVKLAVWGPAPSELRAQLEQAEKVEWVEQRQELPPEPAREARALIESRKAHMVLALTPRPSPGAEGNLSVELFHDMLRDESASAYRRLDKVLAQAQLRAVRVNFERAALTPELAEPLQVKKTDFLSMGMMAVRLLPFLLLVALVLAAFHPAIDTTAGERERGTLHTLLCTPVRPLEVVLGKYAVVLAFALGGASLNLAGMGISFLALGGQKLVDGLHLGALELALSFGALVPLALLVSALMLVVGMMTRSFKEAQNSLTPVMMVVLMLGAGAGLQGVELTVPLALVPVLNVMLLLREMLSGTVDASLFSLVFLSTLGWATAGTLFAARVFENEQVLLSGEKPWKDLFGRRLARADGLSPGRAVIFFAVILCAFLYAGALVPAWVPLWARLIAPQLFVFLLPAVLWARASGANLREVFSLRLPTPRGALAVALLVPAILGLRGLVTKGLEFFPAPGMPEFMRLMEGLLTESLGWPVVVALAVIALAPGVCEEAAFRGVMLTGLSRTGSRTVAVVGSALAFGLIHIHPTQVVVTFAAGLLLGHATLKTRSILAGVVLHFINNASAVLLVRYGTEEMSWLADWRINLALLVVPGAVALWLLREDSPVSQPAAEPLQPAVQSQV
ncbi:MAG TPA: ABC transporter permease subunit/CPBP intramembrane protease [Myxococcaceae bacterium]|nr:ABC transporter permease subunit/CPBP intramembrane protease [Myxococcaceae bacterium]